MALDSQDLYNDIINDSQITNDIPAIAVPKMQEFFERISIHITEQIKRGIVDDVQVDGNGNQINESSVK